MYVGGGRWHRRRCQLRQFLRCSHQGNIDFWGEGPLVGAKFPAGAAHGYTESVLLTYSEVPTIQDCLCFSQINTWV